jgi:hypothetical protein
MKIQFNKSPEQLQLIAAMGHKDKAISVPAQETFANLLAPTLGKVFSQADTSTAFYRDMPFAADSDPTFPLELFTDTPEGYFSIWSQAMPGGLPTNTVHQPIEEVRFHTYNLDTAVSYLAKYARQTRLPVIARALERLVNTVLVKTQGNAWMVLFAALAKAETNAKKHVWASENAGAFSLTDYNKLLTFFRRLNRSWAGGTPVGVSSRPTDLVISPEVMESFRALAYNPVNSKGANNVAGTQYSGVVALPDEERKKIFATAQAPEFFGVNLIELVELGKGMPYNILFKNQIGSTAIAKLDPAVAGTVTFDKDANEVLLAIDGSQDFAYRAIQEDAETGSTFSLQPDDQFTSRSGKIGQVGGITEGRMVLNARPLVGLVL